MTDNKLIDNDKIRLDKMAAERLGKRVANERRTKLCADRCDAARAS